MKLPTRKLVSIFPSGPSRPRAGVRALVGQAINRLENRQLLALLVPADTSTLPPPFPGGLAGFDGPSPLLVDPAPLSPLPAASNFDAGGRLSSSLQELASASGRFFASSPLTWSFRADRISLDPRPPSSTLSQPPPKLVPRLGTPPPVGRAQIAEASVLIQGTRTTELAIANDQLGTVTVIQGTNPVLTVQGLDDPEGVKLADLNNDGIPDLIIADSGLNKVLVYPGQAGGGFGPEVTGGVGYSVGQYPVGLTVADLNGNGLADLIVANKGSNDVSILGSAETGQAWTLTPVTTIKAGIGPFKTVIAEPGTATTDRALVICNSISSDAYIYPVAPDGQIAPTPSEIVSVGSAPNDMFVGRFTHQPDLDLVAVNANSDKLTFISGVFTPHPLRGEISTGLTNPITATSLPADASGANDLIVANSSGQIAFLQASVQGLVLTGLSSPTGLNNVTAIAAGETANGSLSIFEASNSVDTVAVLQFNLGDLSPFQAVRPADVLSSIGGSDDSLAVELVPTGSQMLDLVGLLRNGSSPFSAADQLVLDQTPSRSRISGLGSASTGILALDTDPVTASSREGADEESIAGAATPSWTRFVLGLDAALDSFRGEVGVLAGADSGNIEPDQSTGQLVGDRIGRTSEASAFGPREGSAAESSPWVPATGTNEIRSGPPGLPGFWLVPARARRESARLSSDLTTAALGSGLAVRFLINASPPKPPRSKAVKRSRPAIVGGPWAPWPEALPPMSPHG